LTEGLKALDVGNYRGTDLSTEEEGIWQQRRKDREREKSKRFFRTIANCGLISCWGIAILTIWFLASHEGWAQLFFSGQPPTEWTAFNTGMIQLILLSAIIVTILYVIYRLHLYQAS
jgi:hypothetical protein